MLSTANGKDIKAIPVLKDRNVWSIYCRWTFDYGKSKYKVHPVHTVQTIGVGGGVAQLTLNHSTKHKWVLSPTPWMLNTIPPAQKKKVHISHWIAGCVAPEQSQCCG